MCKKKLVIGPDFHQKFHQNQVISQKYTILQKGFIFFFTSQYIFHNKHEKMRGETPGDSSSFKCFRKQKHFEENKSLASIANVRNFCATHKKTFFHKSISPKCISLSAMYPRFSTKYQKKDLLLPEEACQSLFWPPNVRRQSSRCL